MNIDWSIAIVCPTTWNGLLLVIVTPRSNTFCTSPYPPGWVEVALHKFSLWKNECYTIKWQHDQKMNYIWDSFPTIQYWNLHNKSALQANSYLPLSFIHNLCICNWQIANLSSANIVNPPRAIFNQKCSLNQWKI